MGWRSSAFASIREQRPRTMGCAGSRKASRAGYSRSSALPNATADSSGDGNGRCARERLDRDQAWPRHVVSTNGHRPRRRIHSVLTYVKQPQRPGSFVNNRRRAPQRFLFNVFEEFGGKVVSAKRCPRPTSISNLRIRSAHNASTAQLCLGP